MPTAAASTGSSPRTPLILDLTEDGNRLTRHVDGDGTPGGAVGKALHDNDEHPAYADTGEVLVMGYGADLTGYDLRGFDQESGTEVWALPDDEEVVDDTEASLVTMRSVDTPKRAATADPEQPRNQIWLTAHYPGTDETPEVLARFPDSAATGGLVLSPSAYALGIAGDLVLVQDETELTAYRLPETGSADLYRKATTPEELAWTDDDVRPEDVVNACEAVRPKTLSLLELDPDLPPPAGCTWYADSDHTDPRLEVSVHVALPTETASASEVAAEEFAKWEGDDLLDHRRMKGLGDQAQAGSSNYPDFPKPMAEVLVRSGNVLVRVTAQVDYEALSGTSITKRVIEKATQAAARDVLSHLDIEV